MAIGSGSRVDLAYQTETVRGTPDSPAGIKYLRTTGRNINLEKDILESSEVRASRQRSDVRHGFNRVAGSIAAELGALAYDDWIQYGMGGSWTAVTTTGSPDLQVITATDDFVRATGDFIADGFRIGDYITTTGFTAGANNGTFRIESLTTTIITISPPAVALVDEASTTGRTLDIEGKRIDIGTTLQTVTLERRFNDISQFQVFNGVAINEMAFSVSPESIANVTFGLVGMSADALVGAERGTPAAAPTNAPFAAFDGELYEGTTAAANAIAVVTGLDFTVANNRSLEGVIGSKFSPDVFEGTAVVTGTMTAFLEDAVLMDKFFNETTSHLTLKLDDINGTDYLIANFYKVKYTGGDVDPPQEGPVPISMPFEALEHGTYATALSFQRSNV